MGLLRVGTYNLSGAVGRARRFYGRLLASTAKLERARAGALAAGRLLAGHDLDVVALQEVDVARAGTRCTDQPALIADALDHEVAFVPLTELDLGGWVSARSGLSMSTRTPPLRSFAFELPRRRRLRLFSRRAQVVDLPVAGRVLRIINVHLCHDDAELRARQLRVVLDHARQHGPAVIVGDLNTSPPATRCVGMLEAELYQHDRCMEALLSCPGLVADPRAMSCLEGGPLAGLATYPSDHPVLKLDYLLLVDPSGRFRLGAERVLAVGPELSDHRPVIATLEWSES
ncbi:MAG: endonuclease/exonuclease/phosphatase family protein [Deltaproteobacteria bacterium]|nr:endonuclease/exonuclease/phosphatase family protein [Deltaproteobacteria bacterium]